MKLATLGCLLVLSSPTAGLAQDPGPEEQPQEKQAPGEAAPEETSPQEEAPDTRSPEKQAPEKTAPETEETAEPEPRSVYWEDGLWILGWSGKVKTKIGGQAQNDTAGFVADGSQPVEIENGVEWRRVRVYALGTIGKRWAFKLQWGADRPYLKDAWLQWRFLIFDGRVWLRGGRFTTTFGLENDGSSNDLLFMEQGLPSAFVPPQETGVLLHSESSNRRWDISFSSGASELECLLCKVVGISPRYGTHFDFGREDRLLHLGANYSRRYTREEAVNFAQRPESHIAPVFVGTGPIVVESVDSGFVEAAFIQGPFSVQAEGAVAGVKPSDGRRPVFYGFYVSGSYALTGEMRRYRRRLGTIARIIPKSSWRDGGRGAFEIALRFSRIDLNDGDVRGGTLNDLSFALNWYPNLPGKVSFNVIRAARQGWDPVWVFQGRLQWAY